MSNFQKVAKLISFNGKTIELVAEYQFKANKKYYLSHFYWYGWYENLTYDVGADEFVVKGENVGLEYAYQYALSTNLEAR